MKLPIYIICFIITSILLLACTVSHSGKVKKELDESANPYIGKSRDVLLLTKGAPDYKETLSNGEMVWTYRVSKTGEHKGITISTGDKPRGRPIVSWVETTNFVIDENGIVQQAYTSVD